MLKGHRVAHRLPKIKMKTQGAERTTDGSYLGSKKRTLCERGRKGGEGSYSMQGRSKNSWFQCSPKSCVLVPVTDPQRTSECGWAHGGIEVALVFVNLVIQLQREVDIGE